MVVARSLMRQACGRAAVMPRWSGSDRPQTRFTAFLSASN